MKLNKMYTRSQIDEIRDKLIKQHGNRCSICKKPRSAFKRSLAVDHNHKTGKIRSLLCYYCNKIIVGKQTKEIAQAVLDYLKKFDL